MSMELNTVLKPMYDSAMNAGALLGDEAPLVVASVLILNQLIDGLINGELEANQEFTQAILGENDSRLVHVLIATAVGALLGAQKCLVQFTHALDHVAGSREAALVALRAHESAGH